MNDFHIETYLSEVHVSENEVNWEKFCRSAESLLGHDLDGNDVDQAGCGYSLDEAYSKFSAGVSAADYVREVKGRVRYEAQL